MTKDIGVPTVSEYVRRFGFDDAAVPDNLSLALGAGNIAPLDLVTAYATFANGGYRVSNYLIERITTADGEVLPNPKPEFVCPDDCKPAPPEPVAQPVQSAQPAPPALATDVDELYAPMRVAPQIITPQNAYLMTDLMQNVARAGTGRAAWLALQRKDIAGKTGTTNDGRDTWFVGFNSDVVAAVWVGFDEARPLGAKEQGSQTALPMWIDYMREALARRPEHTLAQPPGIVEYRINPTTGLIANDATRDAVFEKFDIDNIPEREPDPAFSSSDPSAPVDTGRRVNIFE
jgi:penicillin-binding protein 1A